MLKMHEQQVEVHDRLLKSLPDKADRGRQELDLQMALSCLGQWMPRGRASYVSLDS